MKEAKLYIAETPGGAFKAYAVGFGDDYKPGANARTKYKSIPDQPFRGFEDKEEVRLFLLEKFTNFKAFNEWAESCGNGSLCLKDISSWDEVLLPGSKSSGKKKTRKKRRNVATKRMVVKNEEEENLDIEEPDDDEPFEPQSKPLVRKQKIQPSKQSLGIPIEIREETAANNFTYEQYKQVAEGIVQDFENTLLSCMVYNVHLNAANLVHAYRALKLINVLQWTAALEAARMAAIQDQTWKKFYESILNANKMVGLPV